MNNLERDLREVLNKYGIQICEISILFSYTGKNIIEIVVDEMEDKNRRKYATRINY